MQDTAEIIRHQYYFDTVEKLPLTLEQRKAAVSMARRNLLVAAAGSGKTSTIVGKVGYALHTGRYTPDNILVLAFNNKAAQELHQRIHQRLRDLIPPGQQVHTKTFHALGLDIISTVQGKRPCLMPKAPDAASGDAAQLKQLIKNSLRDHPGFAQEWMLFRLFYCRDVRDQASFSRRRHWHDFQRRQGNAYGHRRGFLTFNGELVSSQCLQAVANWLFLHRLNYRYTRTGPHGWWSFWRRVAVPGFFLTDAQLWVLVSAQAGGAQACDSLHAKPGRPYRVLVLSFDDFVSGRLFALLGQALLGQGYALPTPDTVVLIQRLGNEPSPDELHFLSAFIQHARDNQVSKTILRERARDHPQASRAGVLTDFLAMLLDDHASQLQQSGYIDFHEMLDRASRYVIDDRYKHPYTLILVDEFQDTSQASARLINALLQQQPSCMLFAVGDDWQSIYRFAGADCSLFTDFHTYFGSGAINYLSASFRFNQGIADVATRFIQKNPGQMRKQVQAQDLETQDTVVICWYRTPEEMLLACQASLADIHHISPNQGSTSVYLLGRYHHQQPEQLAAWQACYPRLHIQFKTIHAAKGLEADYVLVLGLHAGRYAFPSRIRNDPLLHLVMPTAEAWPDAEERRLLYVALTRARHKVYLIASATTPSDFVGELAAYPGVVQVDWLSGPLPLAASRS